MPKDVETLMLQLKEERDAYERELYAMTSEGIDEDEEMESD